MKQFKMWIVFFGTLLHTQAIFSGNERYLSDKESTLILNGLDSNEFPTQAFKALLEQNPYIISTKTQRGCCFEQRTDETTAHRVANHVGNRRFALELLNLLYNNGETAAEKNYTAGSPEFKTYTGATAFLNLCLQLNKLEENQHKPFLDLLNKFAARTPTVVIQPRDDGKTPAMAIASSDSPIKDQALQILLQINSQAFDGTLRKRNNCFNIANLVIQGFATQPSQNALSMIIQDQKNRYPHTFSSWMLNLIAYAYEINNLQYLPLLKRHISAAPTHSLPNIVELPTLEALCSCCMQQCLCCTQPGANEHHNRYWWNFYSQNPTHPNAQQWLIMLQQRVQALR